MLVTGALGYLMQRNGYPTSAAVLGLVLGHLAETNFLQGYTMSNGDLTIFISRPICILLWILILASLFAPQFLLRNCAKII
jgi:putative tricarboxylic transport membrane protein